MFVSFSAGFCEELIFRGYGITVLVASGWNKWLAALVTSLLFAAIHQPVLTMPLMQFLHYVIFGFLMAVIYIKSNKLWIPMAIHMYFNLFLLLR